MVRYIRLPTKPDFKGTFECSACLGEVEYDVDDIRVSVSYHPMNGPDSYGVVCPCGHTHDLHELPTVVIEYVTRSK